MMAMICKKYAPENMHSEIKKKLKFSPKDGCIGIVTAAIVHNNDLGQIHGDTMANRESHRGDVANRWAPRR